MNYKLKNILTQIFSYILCVMFISNILFGTVSYAVGGSIVEQFIENALWNDPFGKSHESMERLLEYYFAQFGVIKSGNYEDLIDNTNDYLDDIKNVWTPENIQIKTDDNGKKSLVFSKVVADTLINAMKDANKKPDNGGYELVKTVPVSKISRLYFNTNEEYSTIFNLLKDNNGAIGVYRNRNTSGVRYFKVDTSDVWIKGNTISLSSYKFHPYRPYKNVNVSSYYEAYKLNDVAVAAKSWKDSENLVLLDGTSDRAYSFLGYDDFVYSKEFTDNPFSASVLMSSGIHAFIITNSGTTIPVFNTLNDAVEYSVAHNLYYTTSDFTGEGVEVTIGYDELDKVLSGYYSGMYDMLQRLIAQNGGNALTPEQVQELADQVAESFDMLKTEINKGFDEQDKLIEKNTGVLKGIKNTLDEILKYVKKIKFWAAADTVIDGVDLVADLLKFVKDFISDVTVGVNVLVSGLSDTVTLVSEKFPFSIPWDIAFFVNSLAATPETPVFEVPLKLQRYGIDEKFVIDFSHFEIISKVSRSMLTMIYAMGLLKLTDKVIDIKKGGTMT